MKGAWLQRMIYHCCPRFDLCSQFILRGSLRSILLCRTKRHDTHHNKNHKQGTHYPVCNSHVVKGAWLQRMIYQDKKAKAEDFKSSAYTLLLVGIIGIAALVLLELGVSSKGTASRTISAVRCSFAHALTFAVKSSSVAASVTYCYAELFENGGQE